MSRLSRSAFTAALSRSRSAKSETEDRALHRAGIGPEFDHSGVERFLPAAKEEDEGALVDEALRRGEADAGSTTGDHGGLSIQSGHVMDPSLELHRFESTDLLIASVSDRSIDAVACNRVDTKRESSTEPSTRAKRGHVMA